MFCFGYLFSKIAYNFVHMYADTMYQMCKGLRNDPKVSFPNIAIPRGGFSKWLWLFPTVAA